MRVRLLLDENVSPRVKTALLRQAAEIDVLRMGDDGAPPLSTLDPDVLHYLERSQRLLVTFNRASMPGHVMAYLAQGHHHWGILRIRRGTPVRLLVETLLVICEASVAEEWRDVLDWLP